MTSIEVATSDSDVGSFRVTDCFSEIPMLDSVLIEEGERIFSRSGPLEAAE